MPDEEPLQIAQRGVDARRLLRLKRDSADAASQLTLQRELETAAQLRGRLARERDGGHVLDLILAGRDPGRHPRSHHVRLAGTGARLDEQVAIEIRHDRGA